MPNPNVNRKVLWTGSPRRYVNAETVAYISGTVSETQNFGFAVDALITDLKGYGLWTKLKFGLLSCINLDDTLAVMDLKTATILTNAELEGTENSGNRSSMATPLPMGFAMKNSDYIHTGAIPSVLHTLNDTCIAHGILDNVAGATAYQYSAVSVLAVNGWQAVLRTAANSAIVDNYSNVANLGRNTFAGSTDLSGRWAVNRRASNDVVVERNGAVLGSAANGGGTLPTAPMALGCQFIISVPGNYGNHTCYYHLEFSGLSDAELDNLDLTMVAYLAAIGPITRKLAIDGNSWTVYDNAGILRKSQYYTYGFAKKRYHSKVWGVAGNTTAQRNTAYAAGVATYYDATMAKNILIFHEVRNDLYNGATVAVAKTNLDTYITNAETTGFILVIIPPTLANYVGNTGRTETEYNLAIDELYTYCISKITATRYVITLPTAVFVPRSDYASDAAYNTAVAAKIADVTYFYDSTHKTAEANRLISLNLATQALNVIG